MPMLRLELTTDVPLFVRSRYVFTLGSPVKVLLVGDCAEITEPGEESSISFNA